MNLFLHLNMIPMGVMMQKTNTNRRTFDTISAEHKAKRTKGSVIRGRQNSDEYAVSGSKKGADSYVNV